MFARSMVKSGKQLGCGTGTVQRLLAEQSV